MGYPVIRPIADTGLLVEFGDKIDDDVHTRVLALDGAIQDAGIAGLSEAMPAYAALYVGYDPLVTDFATVSQAVTGLINAAAATQKEPNIWRVPVCYAPQFAPDMEAVCAQLGLSPQEVVAAHVSGRYKVYMYGFSPGYAYMGGVPEAIQMPRKPAPVMGVPVGVVMIAGPQALITTVKMPSGWWRIGQTGMTPLTDDPDKPFLFDVGDTVIFEEMSADDFARHGQVSS